MSRQWEDSNMKMREMEIDIKMLARGLKKERLREQREKREIINNLHR